MNKLGLKRIIPLWIILTFYLSLSVSAAEYAYEINNMSVELDVHSDNSYTIREVMSVYFHEERHGLIRQIPRRTNNGAPVSIKNIQVEGAMHTIESDSDWLNIRMGDPDQTIIGPQQYIIIYDYDIGDDRSFSKDELYFNLIGSDFTVPIYAVDFKITMPFPFDEDRLNFTHGSYNSKDNTDVSYSVSNQIIQGSMLKPLGPNEALTIALPLPQGYYKDAPSPSIWPYLIILFPLIFFPLGLFLWLSKARKIQPIPTVEFYPPTDTSSADVGYLIDGQLSASDVTSLLVYWANRGYLTIREELRKKTFRQVKVFWFTKLREPGNDMREYERDLFSVLFNHGDGKQVSTDQLKNKFYSSVLTAKQEIVSSYEDNDETKIFSPNNTKNKRLLLLLAFLSLFPFSLLALSRHMYAIGGELIVTGILMAGLFVFFSNAFFKSIAEWKHRPRKRRLKETMFMGGFFMVFTGIILFIAFDNGVLFGCMFSLIAAIGLVILSLKCHRRTDLGKWYEERLIGFKDFIKATELDRIKLLIHENPNYFYDILPYAMALNVTKEWAKGFEHIAIEPPNWYYGATTFGAFSAYTFANELENNMSEITSDLSSSPSNSQYGSGGSDSSSGGSAGGGSGGGGASDW
jgi:uncharacterized membrane protein YgcG